METLEVTKFEGPFPHLIVEDFYNKEELDLIWEELNYYTKPGKLLPAEKFGGIVGYTNSNALALDDVYGSGSGDDNYRSISNILTVNRKLFDCGVLDIFADTHPCCGISTETNYDITKVRYYHNGEYYKPHTDRSMHFLAFSYFYKEPKNFQGGELQFPQYDYELDCMNNSTIIFPGWVEHGVKEVKIEDSEYYDGGGRYCISSFFGCKIRDT